MRACAGHTPFYKWIIAKIITLVATIKICNYNFILTNKYEAKKKKTIAMKYWNVGEGPAKWLIPEWYMVLICAWNVQYNFRDLDLLIIQYNAKG